MCMFSNTSMNFNYDDFRMGKGTFKQENNKKKAKISISTCTSVFKRIFLRQKLRPTIRPIIRPNLRQPKNSNIRLWPNILLEPEVRLIARYSAKFAGFLPTFVK